VTASLRLVAPPADTDASNGSGFEIGYLTEDAAECRVPLDEAFAVPLECGLPVHRFTTRKGQRHLSGLWWSATTGGHVGFESWLERDQLMLLDFDTSVVGVASQPFWLRWRNDAGEPVAHAPDFFARRIDGSAVVVDCRPVERRPPRDVAKFDAMANACALVGWEYRLVGAADRIVTANVRWLAGYRHPRHRLPETADALQRVFATPAPLMAGVAAAGDPLGVLPVLFHLLWCQELAVDVAVPLHSQTLLVARMPG
jgi:hypothetical protein